jgi:hypothetical protein
MGRIRTLKPEFFTSKDIVRMPHLPRLVYQALWCEADREGRLVWDHETLKLRYFPIESFEEIEAACDALLTRGHAWLYRHDGCIYAWLQKFHVHQQINPRERASVLPSVDDPRSERLTLNLEVYKNGHAPTTSDPRVSDASTTRAPRASHRQEGKDDSRKVGRSDACPTRQQPPTQTEVCEYFAITGATAEMGDGFWNHFESVGWVMRNGQPLVNWRARVPRWITEERAKPRHEQPKQARITVTGVEKVE